jgi:hypothetical protein
MGYDVSVGMDGGLVRLDGDSGTIEVVMNRNLTSDEMAVIAAINEMIRRLKDGKLVSYDFNPKSFEHGQELVRCEWNRSGSLRVHGTTTKARRFVQTVEAAVQEHRSFTCYRGLIQFLPAKKHKGG